MQKYKLRGCLAHKALCIVARTIYTIDRWAAEDGMLCRVNSDCGWLEADLWCYERGLAWRPAPAWFGGRAADITGSCSCGAGLRWGGESLACQVRS